jgi:SAM-dependent methyltransferase
LGDPLDYAKQRMTMADLSKMAKQFAITNISSLKKHELIFEILKANASRNGQMFGEGVHTIGVDLIAPEKKPNQLVVGDALEAEWPKEVDFIFSFRSLHEIGEPEKIIKKAFDSLAAGGKAYLSFRTLDLYSPGKGIGEIGAKQAKALQKMVRSRKLEGFSVNGFEVRVVADDGDGKKLTAGVNVFLEKMPLV